MYKDLEGQFLLVTRKIIQLGVVNAFRDFKHTAHSLYQFIKEGEVTGDLEK
jgi:hypothetical protein